MPDQPPRWAERLVRWAIPPGLSRDAVLGDLRQEHARHAREASRKAADRWYRAEAFSVASRFLPRRIRSLLPRTAAAGNRRAAGSGSGGASPDARSAPSRQAPAGAPLVVSTLQKGDPVAMRIVQDLRFTLRSWRRSPLFFLAAALTLSLGIGATLAMFSVVNGVLLRPVDLPDSERLVHLNGEEGALSGVRMPELLAYRRNARTLEAVAAWQGWSVVVRREGEQPTRHGGASVSAEYFGLLGVRPAAGRFFTDEEGLPGHAPVAVISHELWTTRFGGDPGVVGSTLSLSGEPYVVVGVAPEGFLDPVRRMLGWGDTQVWRADPPLFHEAANDIGWIGFWGIARLRPGASLGAAQRELDAIIAAEGEAAGWEAPPRVEVVIFREALVRGVRPTLLAFFAAVVAVLLIGCANVANLLLSRALLRRREIAVRAALGAARRRLLSQLFVESLALATVGTLVGLWLAWLGARALLALPAAVVPRAEEVGLDWRVALFAAGLTVAAAVLFGLIPSLQVTEGRLGNPLRQGGRGSTRDRGGARFRQGLVVAQVALTVVLLWGAGLLSRTFANLSSIDPGFDAASTLVAGINLDPLRFAEPEQQTVALRRVEEESEALPGVIAVGAITDLPMGGAINSTAMVSPSGLDTMHILVRAVTPGYFDAVGVPVLRGRPFTWADAPGSPEVALVNETTIRRLFRGEDPLGQVVVVRGVPREVVGVVADVKEFTLAGEFSPVLYTPYPQEREGWMRPGVNLVVRVGDGSGGGPDARPLAARGGSDAEALAGALRQAVLRGHPDVIVGGVRPLRYVVDSDVAVPRFRATVGVLFALLGLALAAAGIAGVLAYTVSQRLPEIGVRMALGADRGSVVALVLRQSVGLALAGAALGLVGVFAGARLLAGFLYGVPSNDPLVLAATVGLLLGVAVAASWLPAARAAAVDPARTLRAE